MNQVKSISAALLLAALTSISSFAQSTTRIIAVVNQADWCSVCKSNGQRAMGALMENNKDGAIKFIMNDLSNDETKKKSATELANAGIAKAMNDFKATGVVYFFDAKTKKPITQITVANSNEEIAYVMAEVKKAAK